ncbi:MAG: DUF202 domain-containing protein [Rhodococcus sp. (in: high G+C Gram-positive bacteria)]
MTDSSAPFDDDPPPGAQAERTTLARVRTALTITITGLLVARAVRESPMLVIAAVFCALLPVGIVLWSRRSHSRVANDFEQSTVSASIGLPMAYSALVVVLAVVVSTPVLRP